jgi:hypothetical protein
MASMIVAITPAGVTVSVRRRSPASVIAGGFTSERL